MKKIMSIIISIIALTVMAPGHADEVNAVAHPGVVDTVVTQAQERLDAVVMILTDPIVSFNFTSKDQECLAKNIFYEAANEPEEGKVAVGIVTLNRTGDNRFPNTICGVVNQKTVLERVRTVTRQVRTFFGPSEEKQQVVTKVAVCQFSWKCEGTKKLKHDDERWIESQRIARELLDGGYSDMRVKYQDAKYFHATRIKPTWAPQKQRVNRIGGHIFYADRV
jgi:spore germination cell wall hydrolase CwlJ-like protein